MHIQPSLAGAAPNPMFRIGAAIHGRSDIIHLEFGEPDAPTPAHIVEAAMRSLRDERQGYGPSVGMPFLREAVAARAKRVDGIDTTFEMVITAAGGTGALMASLQCTTGAGDEVLVPDPAWAGYDGMLAATGARMVRYPLLQANGWQPDVDALERLITPRTRVLLINSPSNPAGAVYPRATVERMLEIAQRFDLWVLSDECYDEFIYDAEHVSLGALDSERVITIGTCSKSYAMTGWRVGWAIVPARLTGAMGIVVAAQVNNLPLFTQRAAHAALTGPQECVTEMARLYRSRRDRAVAQLAGYGCDVAVPHGAFYLLIPIVPPRTGEPLPFDSVMFAEDFIRDERVAVAPGAAFGPGAAECVRISLASADDDLRVGVDRLMAYTAARSDKAR